jgi:hypothetical protein
MSPPAPLDLERLLRLRVVVARVGEMDLARWWNTTGQLGRLGTAAVRRGLPRTHYFAQARAVFAVASHRCDEVFNPPNAVTLWRLPDEVEEQFETRWEHWCDEAGEWDPFFEQVAAIDQPDVVAALRAVDLVSAASMPIANGLVLAQGARSVRLPDPYSGASTDLELLALGFGRGGPGPLVVPYAGLGDQ